MKKIFALLALVLGVVSCQTEPEGLDVNVGGEQEVMLTVSLPETTRANSANGFDLSTLATTDYSLRYILEVYLGENCQRHVLVSDNTSVAFPVRLAPDRNYQLVVWADIVEGDSQADRYYNTDPENGGLKAVSIVESTWNAMDETRDAFTATKPVSAQDIASGAITMTLKRPFAKLRVVATDYKDVVELGLKPATATVVYSQDMPRIYNALTGAASNAALKGHTINYPATPVYNDATGEYTLFADYFFVPASGTAKFQFNVYAEGNNLIKATNFNTDIYVAANKLTTIKGDVLTTGANINIDIEGGMDAPSYEYNAIGNATAFYEALNNGGEYIVTSNLVIDQAYVPSAQLTATRTTGAPAEGKVTTINLNGMTITVKNQGNDAFVTLDTNDALILAGEGTITGSGELVDGGNVVVTGDANVDVNVIPDVKLGIDALKYILANGGEFTLTEDLVANEVLFASATNPVVIDLGRNTFTFTSNRGFRINENANVVIKNGSIVNNADAGRCVETRAGGIKLTLENVTLTATNGYYSQPFTVGGEGENITVNINNSTIDAGNNGYGITTFNPVALNINNSTISGYAAFNIKVADGSLGSAGSVINVVGSTLNGVNNVLAGESNSFSTIMIEDENIKINVDSTSIVKATTSNGNGQCIVGFGNELVTSKISGCELTFAGEIVLEGEQTSYVGYSSYQGGLGGNIVKFAAEYADELEAEGWIVGEPTDGLVTIPSAIAKVGDNLYKTLAEAVAAVEDGGTIILVENEVFTKNNRYNNGGWWDGLGYSGDKSFTIDLKNHSISQDGSLNDYLIWIKNNGTKANTITLKNGTLDAGKTAYCALATASSNAHKITINLENIELINDITNGAVVKLRAGAELNIKDGTKIIGKNSYAGIECVASTTNIYEGAEIYQNGTSSSWGFLAGASWGGIINVYGGKGTSARGGFMAMTSGGTINVSGGEWTANVDGTIGNNSNLYVLTAQNNKYESGYKGASIINVTGGTFRGGMDAWILNDVNTEKAELNISGGNFNADPSSYLAEGKVAAQGADGCWTIVDGVKDEAGLKAAFEKGGNIVLGADITVAETVILAEGKTAVLDLNGKKILGGLQTDTSKHIYPFDIYGSLTINDSSANGSIEGRGIFVRTGSNLIVNGGSIYGIDSNGGSAIYQYGGDITINGGLIEQKAEGTYNFAINGLGGTVTVKGGKIAGNHGAIATEAAEVVLNDGEFVCTGTTGMTDNVLYSYSSGTIIINGGTFIADNDGPAGGCCVYDANGGVTINGGVFRNSSGGDVWGTTGTTIKGGKFENLIETSHIAEGYEMNANGEVVKK